MFRFCVCLLVLFAMFFFLMIRRPPRSTLFPTRRSSDLFGPIIFGQLNASRNANILLPWADSWGDEFRLRSEEHTSELQSQFHLVCRLLLEKKKQQDVDLVFSHLSIRQAQPDPLHFN